MKIGSVFGTRLFNLNAKYVKEIVFKLFRLSETRAQNTTLMAQTPRQTRSNGKHS